MSIRIEHSHFSVVHNGLGQQAAITIQLSTNDGTRVPTNQLKTIRHAVEKFFGDKTETPAVQQDAWEEVMSGLVDVVLDKCDELGLICHSVILDPGRGWRLEVLP